MKEGGKEKDSNKRRRRERGERHKFCGTHYYIFLTTIFAKSVLSSGSLGTGWAGRSSCSSDVRWCCCLWLPPLPGVLLVDFLNPFFLWRPVPLPPERLFAPAIAAALFLEEMDIMLGLAGRAIMDLS